MILKSDRAFIKRMVIPGFIFSLIGLIIVILDLIFNHETSGIVELIAFLVFSIGFGIAVFVTLLKPKPFYEFGSKEIIINKKGVIQKIQIDNISSMKYYKVKLLYLITLFFPEGGCMKIHITDKENNNYQLGFISYKNAMKVQILYPDLLKID